MSIWFDPLKDSVADLKCQKFRSEGDREGGTKAGFSATDWRSGERFKKIYRSGRGRQGVRKDGRKRDGAQTKKPHIKKNKPHRGSVYISCAIHRRGTGKGEGWRGGKGVTKVIPAAWRKKNKKNW